MPFRRDTLVAFYDLSTQPLTADCTFFACATALRRRAADLTTQLYVIVPAEGSDCLESERYKATVDKHAREMRVGNYLTPILSMAPETIGVVNSPSRAYAAWLARNAGARVFPAGYTPAMPTLPGPDNAVPNSCLPLVLAARRRGEDVALLRPSRAMLDKAAAWIDRVCGGKPCVTLSLRDYDYTPERNSNTPEWLRLASWLSELGLSPVFIPDFERAGGAADPRLSGWPACEAAAISVEFRAALYENAFLNLGVNAGPMALAWLNERAASITFKLAAPGIQSEMEKYQSALGYEVGERHPFAGDLQRWVWAPDDFAIMRHEAELMIAVLERNGRSIPTNRASA